MLELGRRRPLRTGITLSGIFELLTRSGLAKCDVSRGPVSRPTVETNNSNKCPNFRVRQRDLAMTKRAVSGGDWVGVGDAIVVVCRVRCSGLVLAIGLMAGDASGDAPVHGGGKREELGHAARYFVCSEPERSGGRTPVVSPGCAITSI